MKEDHTSATSSNTGTSSEKENENTTSRTNNNNEETKFESTNVTIIQSFLDTISSTSSSTSTMTVPVKPKGYTIDQIDTSSIKVLEELLLEQLNHNNSNNNASSNNTDTSTGKTVHFSYSTPTNSYTNTMIPNAPEKPSVSFVALSQSPSTNNNSTGTMKSNSSTNTSSSTGTGTSSNNNNTVIDDMTNEYHDENIYNQMTDTERMMYNQIQYQMKMIRQIQIQLNHITTSMMDQQQHQQQQQQQQGGVTYPSTKTSTNRNIVPIRQAGVTMQLPQETQLPQAPQQQQPNNTNNENHNSIFHSIQNIRQRIITKVQNQFLFITKMIHLFKLYRNLLVKYRTNQQQQQQRNNNNNNNNFDPFVIIKILLMISILMSRLPQKQVSKNSNRQTIDNDDDEISTTYVDMMIMILNCIVILFGPIILYIILTKQIYFLYLFCFKYNIPKRIMLYQKNQNNNEIDNDNNSNEMITADEIWAEHLANVQQNNAQQQPQQQQQQQGGGGVLDRMGIIGGNANHQNQINHYIEQVQNTIQWLLLHDWYNGQPIHPTPEPEERNNTNSNNETETNDEDGDNVDDNNNNEEDVIVPQRTTYYAMVLGFIQDMIIFVVSFILSILPIWRNIDPQTLLFQQQQQERAERERQRLLNNEQQVDHNDNGNDNIPLVQPPIDPAAE